mmetsp:Transcript_30328/g.65618  ORF Transcript_30328/g.65618 Transcript_30328/m.65618 type:complete len:379 (+) Transcript_30328:151-1287(+)
MSSDGRNEQKHAAPNEPTPKKLRSSEPDLKVVLGSSGGDGGGGEVDLVTRWYHSQTLAAKSRYVDAMLASPMRERETRTISFPDIQATSWDLMMKFLDDPIAIRTMEARDVMKVAKHYDKYEFCDGRRLCDMVLVDYFKRALLDEESDSLIGQIDVDALVESVALAHEANLEKSFKEGMKYIWANVQSNHVPYGRTMFTEDNMETLAPLLSVSREMFSKLNPRFGDLIGDLHDELDKPDFPKRFVHECRHWLTRYTFCGFIAHIELSGTNGGADGQFYATDTECYQGAKQIWSVGGQRQQVQYEIKLQEKGWTILQRTPLPGVQEEDDSAVVEKAFWIAPYSVNLPLPPKSGWKAVDPLANGHGSPRIRYLLEEEGTM